MCRLAILPLALLTGCHATGAVDAGPSATRDVAVPGTPHAVSLDSPDDVEVTRGAYAIHASGPKAILDRLTFDTRDGTLHIGRKSGVNVIEAGDVSIRVSMPAIDALAVAGSGSATLDRADGREFGAVILGSGDLNIRHVDLNALAAVVSGSGNLSAAGRARSINAEVSGSGDADLARTTSDATTIALGGSGEIKLGASHRVAGSVSGSGDLTVAGHPACTVAKSGSGEVTCG